MLLKSDEILRALSGEEDPFGRLRIVPSPSVEEIRSSGAASVDLRLGRWFLQLREGRTALLDPSKRDGRDEES